MRLLGFMAALVVVGALGWWLTGAPATRVGVVASVVASAVVLAAHFDSLRRAALYESLHTLGSQVWLTGADPAAFADLVGRAQVLHVKPGTIET
jgi:hypothetical protein